MVSKSGITFQIVLLLRRLLALRRWNILIEEYLGANGKLNVEYPNGIEVKKEKFLENTDKYIAVLYIGSNTGRNVNSEVRKSGRNVICKNQIHIF